jgi:eukaryotic-like serine/threonine-protein kinase
VSTNQTFSADDLESPPDRAPARTTRSGFGSTVLPSIDRSAATARLRTRVETRFEITGSLGQGGLGEVVGAIDHDIGRNVAIKRVRADKVSEAALIRFLQEIRTVGRLEHANIVPIHDVGRDDDGALYFVMRFVDGETLEEIIDRLRTGDRETHRQFGFERRARIAGQVLEALSYAHSHGIVHRDVKPANIMIGRYGEVMLLDWGVARLLDGVEPSAEDGSEAPGLTRAGAVIGTPAYMSPEQARGEPVDERSDLFSLALVLHELLTTRHYLADVSGSDAMLREVQRRPVPFAGFARPPWQDAIPADLIWFVDKGVQKDPAARYQTAAEMLDRLARRAEGDIPVQCPYTFARRATNAAFRFVNRRSIAALAALAVVGLGTVAAAAVGLVTVGVALLNAAWSG